VKYYRKLIAAVAGAVTVTAAALADWAVSPEEGAAIAGAWVAAYGVYKLRNRPLPARTPPDAPLTERW
jgi:hypothetical protein